MPTTRCSIPFAEFMKYKSRNMVVYPDLVPYINTRKQSSKYNNKYRSNNNNNRRRRSNRNGEWIRDSAPNKNWLIANRYNKTTDDKIKGDILGCLNKLSKDNFVKIKDNIMCIVNTDITTENQFKVLIDALFTKAIAEETYCIHYTKICKELISHHIPQKNNKKINFRTLLMNKCQSMFEDIILVGLDNNIENSSFRFKSNIVGCVRFLGEIYNNNMLPITLLIFCFDQLFLNVKPHSTYLIDCVCEMMTVVGKRFFKYDSNSANKYMDNMNKIKNSGIFKTKEKFAIMDIFDLKDKEQW
uniref:Middle domain of initiation factor 4G n=1 Tax=Mimivirus LCMiAC01 TaxID=2506608 RepID=A0A481YYU3_9VIRU|nr:MAG: middle domain of initiation factor 4G [Mimivirus LCMiAC01]